MFDAIWDGHVVFDGVEAAEDEVDLGGGKRRFEVVLV
jgi:hypothetical protein